MKTYEIMVTVGKGADTKKIPATFQFPGNAGEYQSYVASLSGEQLETAFRRALSAADLACRASVRPATEAKTTILKSKTLGDIDLLSLPIDKFTKMYNRRVDLLADEGKAIPGCFSYTLKLHVESGKVKVSADGFATVAKK